MAEEGLIFRGCFAHPPERLLGDDEDMRGGLGVDIANSEALLVFVFEISRDFAIGDFLEKRLFFGHGLA